MLSLLRPDSIAKYILAALVFVSLPFALALLGIYGGLLLQYRILGSFLTSKE